MAFPPGYSHKNSVAHPFLKWVGSLPEKHEYSHSYPSVRYGSSDAWSLSLKHMKYDNIKTAELKGRDFAMKIIVI